jgi:N-terminal domain of anti-restriction factor ArdC
MNDKLQAAHDKLQEAVAEIVSGDEWKRMLSVAAKFHNYSFNNQLMIFLQRPDATVVAGFNRWKSLGRFAKSGQSRSTPGHPFQLSSAYTPQSG